MCNQHKYMKIAALLQLKTAIKISLRACRVVVSWCWESPNYNYSVYMWQYETEIASEGHGFVSVRKPHVYPGI